MGHVDTSIPNNVVILHLDLLLTLVYLSGRPPVVTIMGHVGGLNGKMTTLLDATQKNYM